MTEQNPKTERRADFSLVILAEASAEERISRIEALHAQFQRGTTDLLVLAYRLGVELKALRDRTAHGSWERLVQTRLTFIGLRTAYAYMRLARAFGGEEELAGLTLQEAKKLARGILGEGSSRKPAEKRKRAVKGELGRCDAFIEYGAGGRLEKKAAESARQECLSLRERYTTILMMMEKGIRACDKRLKSLGLRLVDPLAAPEEEAGRAQSYRTGGMGPRVLGPTIIAAQA